MGTPDESPHILAPGRLGAAAVTFHALAATAPIAVLTSVVPAVYAQGGGPLVPLSIVGVAALLLFFAAGYAAMNHRAPFAGALYTYVAKGLGRASGIASAWVAVLSYHALQLGLYGVVGAAAAPLLRSWFGVTAEWWMVAGACWLLITLLGTIRVEVTSGLLALLVLAEGAVIAGYAAANIIEPFDGGLTSATILPADPTTIDRPALGLLLAVGVLAFIGFETTGTYAEESLRPRRDPGQAVHAAVVAVAVLLGGAAWSLGVAAGPERIGALARARGSEVVFDLAAARLAPWAVTLGRLMLFTGLVAAILALHHVIARYFFALGRESVLPPGLAHSARRTLAPRSASLTQSAIAGVALAAAYLAGLDDPGRLARELAVGGGLGILLVLLATSLAALLHLNRVPGNEGAWGRFFAPVLSTVALGTLAFLVIDNVPEWYVPVAVGAVIAVGLLHGVLLRWIRPVVYAGIGLSGIPVVVTPQLPDQRHPGAHRPERVNR